MITWIKTIFALLILMLAISAVNAQSVINQGNTNTITRQLGGVAADKWLVLPNDTLPQLTTSLIRHGGLLAYKYPNLYLFDTVLAYWVQVGSDAVDSSVFVTVTRLNDTAAAIRADFTDSLNAMTLQRVTDNGYTTNDSIITTSAFKGYRAQFGDTLSTTGGLAGLVTVAIDSFNPVRASSYAFRVRSSEGKDNDNAKVNYGIWGSVVLSGLNTGRWPISGANHPAMSAFYGSVSINSGASDTVDKASVYYGTMSGVAPNTAYVKNAYLLSLGVGSGMQIGSSVGILLNDLDRGLINNVGIHLSKDNEPEPPTTSNFGIYEALNYVNYFSSETRIGNDTAKYGDAELQIDGKTYTKGLVLMNSLSGAASDSLLVLAGDTVKTIAPFSTLTGNYFINGGNAVTSTSTFGTTTSNAVSFVTANIQRGLLNTQGQWNIGDVTVGTSSGYRANVRDTGQVAFGLVNNIYTGLNVSDGFQMRLLTGSNPEAQLRNNENGVLGFYTNSTRAGGFNVSGAFDAVSTVTGTQLKSTAIATGISSDEVALIETADGELKKSGIALSSLLPTSAISGTNNTLVKFSSTSTIGNSSITDNGTVVTSSIPVTISRNANSATVLNVNNTTSGTASLAGVYFTSNSGAATGQVYKLSSGYTTYKTLTGGDFGFFNSANGNISILNDFATGNITLTAGGSATPHLTIASTGAATFAGAVTVNAQTNTQNIEPITDNTYYIGENSSTTPHAYKGLILKDQSNGNYYRIEMVAGVLTTTLL